MFHDIEKGHKCPRCRRKLFCTIEDGYCENDRGMCNQCILKAERKAMNSEDWAWRVAQQERYDRENPPMSW